MADEILDLESLPYMLSTNPIAGLSNVLYLKNELTYEIDFFCM